MTLTVTVVSDPQVPTAARVTVVSSPSVLDQVTLWRVHGDGQQYRVLVERGDNVIAGSWVVRDYHPPFDETVTYTATTDGGQTASKAFYMSSFPGPGWDGWGWLSSPDGATLALPVPTGAPPVVSRKPRVEKVLVHGRPRPVVKVLGQRTGRSSSASFLCQTDEEAVALWDALTEGGPVLLRTNLPVPAVRWAWIQPDSDDWSWPADRVRNNYRVVSFPYEEVDQPDYDVRPSFTVGEHKALGLTVAQSATTFDTVADLKFDRRT